VVSLVADTLQPVAHSDLRFHCLDVVTTCRSADSGILQVTLDGLRRFVPFRKAHVITACKNMRKFRRALGPDVELIDENAFIPEMTLSRLKKLSLPGFPQGAGWHFQQLLKLAFSFHEPDDDYFLIWDADTVPLRPLQFFDESGRMLFTTAEEEHAPYFDTYRKLLREEPHRGFSFISQHMIVQKSIAREMLGKIETNFSGQDSWAWKIMRNLEGTSTTLFSEYEMLGHFVKNHYPSRAAFRKLSWLREGALRTSRIPSKKELDQLAQTYDFAAFESRHMPLRRFVHGIRAWIKRG
jgi:uncharacterized protein DUF6492